VQPTESSEAPPTSRRSFTAAASREVVGVAVGFSVLAIAFSPRNAAALTALLCGGLWPVLLVGLRMSELRRPGRALTVALSLCTASVVLMLARSSLAADMRVSLVGALGQHAGALTWLVALLVLLAAVVTARPGDVGRTARAMALVGGVLAVAATLDRIGAFAVVRFSPEPSGFMENSGSLAQLLVVSACAAAAWMLAARTRAEKGAAAACLAACLCGLIVAQTSGAWVGLLVGISTGAVVLVLARSGRLRPAVMAGVLVGILMLSVIAISWMLADGVSPGIEQRLAVAANDRFTIWTSALGQIKQAPVLGSGAEQFSAWVNWDVEPGPQLSKTGTYDTHNLALYWLVSVGIVGALLAACAAGAMAARLFAAVVRRPQPAVVALVAGCVAWVGAVMFVWISPLALFAVALFAGQLSVGGEPDPGSRIRLRPAVPLVIALCGVVASGMIFAWGASAEYRWADMVDRGTVNPLLLRQLAVSTGDPSLAVEALESALEATGSDTQGAEQHIAALEPILARAASWHVDAAFGRFVIESMRAAPRSVTSWRGVEAGLAAGRSADPTSGLWDSAGALQAAGLGLDEYAQELSLRASEFILPAGAASALAEIEKQ